MSNEIEKFLGWRNSDDNNSQKSIKNNWDDSYRFEVIGTSYCGSRHFAVNQETFEKLESFKVMSLIGKVWGPVCGRSPIWFSVLVMAWGA